MFSVIFLILLLENCPNIYKMKTSYYNVVLYCYLTITVFKDAHKVTIYFTLYFFSMISLMFLLLVSLGLANSSTIDWGILSDSNLYSGCWSWVTAKMMCTAFFSTISAS